MTMAVSASISNRCGLTARIASASAMTRVKSTSDGLMMAGGGMAVLVECEAAIGSGNHLSNLAQFRQKHVWTMSGVLELVWRSFEGGPVSGIERRFHSQPLGRGNVAGQLRADVQHFVRANPFHGQGRQCRAEDRVRRLTGLYFAG